MNLTPTERAQLLRELGRFCENSPLEGAIDLAGRAYTAAAEEIEGREVGHDLDDVIDQVWRLHQTIGYQGERLMYEQDFDRAVRLVIARFGGGEGE